MKTIFKSTKAKVYLVLVLVSLVTVLTTAYIRMSAESQNNQVEIVLNYSQIMDLAKQSDEDEQWWLEKFSQMGATSVGLTERTLINFLEARFIQYEMTGTLQKEGSDFLALSDEVKAYINQADAFDLVIMPENKGDFDIIVKGLSRYKLIDVTTYDQEGYYVIINRDADHVIYENSNTLLAVDGSPGSTYKKVVGVDALELPIGFDDELIQEIDNLGMEVVLRPGNTRLFKDEVIANYVDEISKYDNVNPLLLLTGIDMLGYDEENTQYIKDTYDLLEEKGMQIGLVESLSQSYNVDMLGLTPILDTFESDKFVRVFSLWPYIQQRYKYAGYEGGEEIGNSIYRAVIQRNIRVIYFNPFMSSQTDYVTDIDAYELVFDQLTSQLEDRGITIGSYTTMGVVGLPSALRIMLYVEVLLFGLVLLNEGLIRLSAKWNVMFGILAIIGSIGAAYVVPNLSMKVFALLSAIVFSSLSGIIFYKYFFSRPGQKSSFVSGVLIMILTTMITMIGGLYVGSILMSGKFYLAIDNFMGVKFSLLIPVMVVVAYVALEYVKEKANNDHQNFLIEMKDEFLALLKHPIQVRHVLIVGILGVVGYIYIARTGNVSAVKPMEIEIVFRNFLETTLVARPRNKELLLAFPAIILAIYYKKDIAKLQIELKYLARLGAMMLAIIGYTSITNTFSHIRTLIYVSVARTLLAVIGSILVALIFWLAIKLMVICYKFIAHWIKKQIETMD